MVRTLAVTLISACTLGLFAAPAGSAVLSKVGAGPVGTCTVAPKMTFSVPYVKNGTKVGSTTKISGSGSGCTGGSADWASVKKATLTASFSSGTNNCYNLAGGLQAEFDLTISWTVRTGMPALRSTVVRVTQATPAGLDVARPTDRLTLAVVGTAKPGGSFGGLSIGATLRSTLTIEQLLGKCDTGLREVTFTGTMGDPSLVGTDAP